MGLLGTTIRNPYFKDIQKILIQAQKEINRIKESRPPMNDLGLREEDAARMGTEEQHRVANLVHTTSMRTAKFYEDYTTIKNATSARIRKVLSDMDKDRTAF